MSWSIPQPTDIAEPRRVPEALADDATYSSATIEALLSAKVLAPKTGAALRRRYLL